MKKEVRCCFIVSDGEDHEGNYKIEVDDLSKKDIVICSINLGTDAGGPIPIKSGNNVIIRRIKKVMLLYPRLMLKLLNQ